MKELLKIAVVFLVVLVIYDMVVKPMITKTQASFDELETEDGE